MTVTELRNEFNILFDSVASNSAPALDDYELSVFLTRSQEELVKNKFDALSNNKGKGFEQSSKRRNDLKNLIKNYNTSIIQTLDSDIGDSSTFFIIPSDVFLIIQESAEITDNSCNGDTKKVKVIPKTHDEYNVQIDNPFKKPDNNTIWRLDYSAIEVGNNLVELISDNPVTKYKLRYLRYPKPIILSDLTSFGEGLSIEGNTAPATSELDKSVHIEIVKRAVETAILSFRENNLNNNIEFNQRVE